MSKIRETIKTRSTLPLNDSILREPLKVSLVPVEERQLPGETENNVVSQEIIDNLKAISKQVENMKKEIIQARSNIAKNKTLANLIINGTLEVTGESNVQDLKLRTLNDERMDVILDDCVR